MNCWQVVAGPLSIAEDIVRVLHDAISIASMCLQDPRLVVGGGSVEAELHMVVRSHARDNCSGIKSKVLEEWANAVLAVVRTLAENAGVNPAVTQVRLPM
jgi:chaperonin GroEL (HSP60 family)